MASDSFQQFGQQIMTRLFAGLKIEQNIVIVDTPAHMIAGFSQTTEESLITLMQHC